MALTLLFSVESGEHSSLILLLIVRLESRKKSSSERQELWLAASLCLHVPVRADVWWTSAVLCQGFFFDFYLQEVKV